MNTSTPELYVILETTNKDYILQCYYKQKTYSINITDKINEICKMLEKTWGKIILMVCLNRRCD